MRRLLKDLQVRFLLQLKTDEYEGWEHELEEHDIHFITEVIERMYVAHGE